jgi:hypothetical protein
VIAITAFSDRCQPLTLSTGEIASKDSRWQVICRNVDKFNRQDKAPFLTEHSENKDCSTDSFAKRFGIALAVFLVATRAEVFVLEPTLMIVGLIDRTAPLA